MLFMADSDRNGGGVKPKEEQEGERLEVGSISSEAAGGGDMFVGVGKMEDSCGD